MIEVLFVCLGNICRSPMAEAIFRHKVERQGLADRINVDSAGTGAWHVGKPPHEGTCHILKTNNISVEGMVARQFALQDFERFDYIVVMDQQNSEDILSLSKETNNIKRLLDFVPDSEVKDVPDPYYSGNFDRVYQLVDKGCEHLLTYIKAQC